MKIYLIAIILILFELFNISVNAQPNIDTCNCPPQYTHSEILNSSIKIGKVIVLDSIKYSTLPSTINNLDSLSRLILYPEIAKRAIIYGEVKYLLSITNEGKVKEIKLIKGLGAGLDEVSLDILKELNFNPAKIKNIAVECEVNITVIFKVHKTIDEPDIVLDEIKYESVGRTEYFKTTIVFKKDSSAYYKRRNAGEIEEAVGKISPFKYSKLSEFILSQCFFSLKEIYTGRTTKIFEVPVGFKWFVNGLIDGSFGFGGEESAGASFLRKNGTVWTTDKDGIIMDLLACEMTARTGKDPADLYKELEGLFGKPSYIRIDAPATPAQIAILKKLSPDMVTAHELAGEQITAKLTRAPGNNAEIGGLKVITKNGWFAARPSGTEDIYKLYAESFLGEEHLQKIQEEAMTIVSTAFSAAGV